MSYKTEDVMYAEKPQICGTKEAPAWQPGSRSTAEYRALDAAHHIHPFSDMGSLNRAGSRVIVKAQGVYLWDSDGNKIIDGMAGLWGVDAGYGPTELAERAT